MFFLLYIPVISRPMSPEAIEEMAAQLADRMLEFNPNAVGSGDNSPRDKDELQQHIAEMMTSLQEEHGQEGLIAQSGLERGESDEEAELDEGIPADDIDSPEEVERLLPARDFLERCFKKSA